MTIDTSKQKTPHLDILRLVEAVRGSQMGRVLYETRFTRKDAILPFYDDDNPAEALDASSLGPVGVAVTPEPQK